MRDSISDAEVIAASLRDASCFLTIFDRHFDAISRYLRRRVTRDTADELAAEVFATACSARSRYDLGRADARPWLYGIATNLLRAHSRLEDRELASLARIGIDPLVGPDPAVVGFRSHLDPVVAAAMLSLAQIDREVLLLFAWAELSYDEIAAALELPVGTVKSRLNRARAEMQRALTTYLSTTGEEEGLGG